MAGNLAYGRGISALIGCKAHAATTKEGRKSGRASREVGAGVAVLHLQFRDPSANSLTISAPVAGGSETNR